MVVTVGLYRISNGVYGSRLRDQRTTSQFGWCRDTLVDQIIEQVEDLVRLAPVLFRHDGRHGSSREGRTAQCRQVEGATSYFRRISPGVPALSAERSKNPSDVVLHGLFGAGESPSSVDSSHPVGGSPRLPHLGRVRRAAPGDRNQAVSDVDTAGA